VEIGVKRIQRWVVLSLLLVPIWWFGVAWSGELDVSHGPTLADERPAKQVVSTPKVINQGKRLYEHYCWPCHGLNGAGNGPVADTLNPRPRDFTQAHFKIRSTGYGELPTDADLFRTISRGILGTAMPSWKHRLTEDERWAVLHYLKTFSNAFNQSKPQSLQVENEPPATADNIAKGKKLFSGKGQCLNCHGPNGRGNGPFTLIPGFLKDARGDPVLPRNLTKGWTYKGGNTSADIYLRLSTGLNGTPMSPPMAPLNTLTSDERWTLAHFVRSLQRPQEGRGKVVLRARKVTQPLSLDPSADIWKTVPGLDVELTGQVHVAPRNENPTVDFVQVKTLYNENELALRLQWDDPTANTTHEDTPQTKAMEAAKFGQTYPVLYPPSVRLKNLRDGVAVQWPVKIPDGPIKPHFMQGDAGHPVNLWHWKADWQENGSHATPVEEKNAKGYQVAPQPQPAKNQDVQGKGVWEDGQWAVVLKRPLQTSDSDDVQLQFGHLIPVAFHVWDGANGEVGLRRSISSWYFLLLESEPPVTLYLFPLFGIGLALGLEYWAIRRVRKGATPPAH